MYWDGLAGDEESRGTIIAVRPVWVGPALNERCKRRRDDGTTIF